MKILFIALLLSGLPILASEEKQEDLSTKKITLALPLEPFFIDSDILPQTEVEPDPVVLDMTRESRDFRASNSSNVRAQASCVVQGNPLTVGSPDRKYTFTFARLVNCGLDVVLISRGVDIRVNGRIVKNWERRRLSLGEMRELLFRKGAGQNLRVATSSAIQPARKVDAELQGDQAFMYSGVPDEVHYMGKADPLLQKDLKVPGWLYDLIKAIVSIFDEVCVFFGGDKTICKFGEQALKLLADTTIKKIKNDIVLDRHSIVPTLYFANAGRFGARKESIEAYVWTASVLQSRSDYNPAERLYLIVTQTMSANQDARAGQAWARTVEQLPQ